MKQQLIIAGPLPNRAKSLFSLIFSCEPQIYKRVCWANLYDEVKPDLIHENSGNTACYERAFLVVPTLKSSYSASTIFYDFSHQILY